MELRDASQINPLVSKIQVFSFFFLFLTSVDCKLFCSNYHTGFLNLSVLQLLTINHQRGKVMIVMMLTETTKATVSIGLLRCARQYSMYFAYAASTH